MAAVILSEYSQIYWIIFTGCVYLQGSLCEQTVKKGGTTRFRPRPFVRTGALFIVIQGAKVQDFYACMEKD